MRRICWGLVGPKIGNVENVLVFKAFLEGRASHGYAKESLQPSGPWRWEGVGGGKPSPLGLVLEVWRVCGCIYTPGGQRPRRIFANDCIWFQTFVDVLYFSVIISRCLQIVADLC